MSSQHTATVPDEFLNRMHKFEEDLKAASSSADRDTLNRLRTDFTTFKNLVWPYLSMLSKQVSALTETVDALAMRQRRKCLLFHSVPESDDEDVQEAIYDVCTKFHLKDFSTDCIKSCHRLGAERDDDARPILVRFVDHEMKSAIWKSKSKLKGSSVSIAEFLTRSRQSLFINARKYLGMRQCWSLDGNIFVKPLGGSRHTVRNEKQLSKLKEEFPMVESPNPRKLEVDPKKAVKIPRVPRSHNK